MFENFQAFAIENGRCYMAMELCEHNLAECVRIEESLKANQTKWTWQIIKGLSTLHETLGIVHGNLMVNRIIHFPFK